MAGRRKEKEGIVVSDKMDKTIVVEVEERRKHPWVGKIIKRHIKFKAHDKDNSAKMGDRVSIQETRPLSKTKCWALKEILEKAIQ